MNNNITNAPEPHRQVQPHEVDEILQAMWEKAVRRNPMVLVKMVDPNTAIEHLRQLVRDCLGKGLSASDTCDHAVQELLNSAVRSTQ
jgi:hypothetical protein